MSLGWYTEDQGLFESKTKVYLQAKLTEKRLSESIDSSINNHLDVLIV